MNLTNHIKTGNLCPNLLWSGPGPLFRLSALGPEGIASESILPERLFSTRDAPETGARSLCKRWNAPKTGAGSSGWVVTTLFLRKQKQFLFTLDGFMQTEAVSNPIFGAN